MDLCVIKIALKITEDNFKKGMKITIKLISKIKMKFSYILYLYISIEIFKYKLLYL